MLGSCVFRFVSTCWHDGRNPKVGKGSVLKLQSLFAKLHLHSTLEEEK